MGKQFKAAIAAAKPVYSQIIGSAQQGGAQEVQEVPNVPGPPAKQTTQGRKGARLPRINMAFSPENLDYLRTMSALRGESMTSYVNGLVAQERGKNGQAFAAAKQLAEQEGEKAWKETD